MMRPLSIDLFCGLGGWTDGLLADGYDDIGFDIERHEYGDERYPAQLVLQDVLTIHGSQFNDAALIVASPPCQEYSYMAMPWSKAKEKRRNERERLATVEHVDRAVVWSRESGTCYLCRREVDPRDWHLEHVIPIALGGEHSYANVRVAHPLCNLRKGTS